MTHLRIEQNNIPEVVTSNVIHKLYETAKAIIDAEAANDVQESQVSLKGNLQVSKAYGDEIDWLETKFPDLHITASARYIRFQDSAVESLLANRYGDGTGLTATQAALIQNFNSIFGNNTSIEYFEELSQFQNITEINENNRFNSCTNLKRIDLSNITKISGSNGYQRWNFESCTNLEDVGDTSNCTYFGYMAFNNCSKLSSVDLSSAVYIGTGAFYNCSKLEFSNLPTSITYVGESAFMGVKKLPTVINLPNLTALSNSAFAGNSDIVHVQNLGTIDTFGYGTDGYGWNPFQNCNNIETIILPETVTTIGYGSGDINKMRWIKILSTVVPNLLTYWAFGSRWAFSNPSNEYQGLTYPIYVRDDLYSTYLTHTDDNWQYFLNRLRPMSQFATDFPNG